MNTELTTLCYLESGDSYLMLHRVKKEHDINKDKWIGVGGHFLTAETPEECVVRETREETGLTLTSFRYRGIITFIYGDVCEYMSLFTADGWTGEEIPCDEGELAWLPKAAVYDLDVWEGDKIFFRLLDGNHPFFSLKLRYNDSGVLLEAALDGQPIRWDADGRWKLI